ncbi:hypothetical protein Ahy_B06g080225 isoform A [Arachis hypogaea]|uniref:Uncharacterized protein n=1 Tax=Arachis hypogaea TaxID=3818 RepID=A0A444YHE2_ARAHY|nr:hypothetical protein Ahy_B06g080225 isoform A [Arachis hypogaea]
MVISFDLIYFCTVNNGRMFNVILMLRFIRAHCRADISYPTRGYPTRSNPFGYSRLPDPLRKLPMKGNASYVSIFREILLKDVEMVWSMLILTSIMIRNDGRKKLWHELIVSNMSKEEPQAYLGDFNDILS